jgi:predicted CXXCH cytochrome family protein
MKKTLAWLIIIFCFAVFPSLPFAATNKDCMECHSEKGLSAERKGKTVSLYVDLEKFSRSVHKQVGCTQCHPDADVKEFPHPEMLVPVKCSTCHADENAEFNAGIHGKALAKKDPYAPTCSDCHGNHYILPPKNPASLTYKMNVPLMCGKCHREGAPVARMYNIPEKNILDNYSESIHGEGLFKQGLIVTATCNDCHGDHLILPHTDFRASTSPYNIAKTCQACHAKIEEVHLKVIEGKMWEQMPGAIPACSDCHVSHKMRKENITTTLSDQVCLRCHGKPLLSRQKKSMHVDDSEIQSSVHKNIPCVKCHSDVSPKHARPCDTSGRIDCAACHAQTSKDYGESAHGQAHLHKKADSPYCTDCHGKHFVISRQDTNSPVYRANIPHLCGTCHGAKGKAARVSQVEKGNVVIDYATSVHGVGLQKKGLIPTAICTDCHNSHLILDHKAERSSINAGKVSATCGRCHQGIYDIFAKSIHSRVVSRTMEPLPTCKDCHSSHEIKLIKQDKFMTEVTDQCGRCHQALGKSYLDTMHGKAYRLGHLKSAKCSDCHGAHDILGVNNPNSRVGFNQVVRTCRKCHPDANRRFTGYLTHATHHDKLKYPILYITFWAMTSLLLGTFIFFGLHTLLWLPKSFAHMLKKRKLETTTHERYYIRRFTNAQRISHLILIFCFIGLALTGMVLKFADMSWARLVSDLLGGVESAGRIHRISAVVLICLFLSHIYSLIKMKLRRRTPILQFLFGKDSMLPNLQDLKDFRDTMKWFFGRGPRPDYGYWTYWEKFDYLAVFWGVPVIGISGLMLWFPEISARFFPGWLINVATIVHSDEALLATGFIFTVHFFNTHLRPEGFPMDRVIFTGVVPLNEYRLDRLRDYEEQKQNHRLKKNLVLLKPSPLFMRFVYGFGFFFLGVGLVIILLIIYSMLFGYR